MKNCSMCNISFDSHSLYANHMRWKHNDQEKYKEKLKDILHEKKEKRLGVFIESIEECESCNEKFTYTKREFEKIKRFCSPKCSRSYSTQNKREEINKKISITLKSKFPLKSRNCKNCDSEHFKNRIFCSGECRKDFGRKKISKYHHKRKYKLCSDFRFSIYKYPDEYDFKLVEEFGWYKASNRGNNLTGVSRDHQFSVNEGLEKGINPFILSHPANCKLMVHGKNSSKGKKSFITLEDLKDKIFNWDLKYGNYFKFDIEKEWEVIKGSEE